MKAEELINKYHNKENIHVKESSTSSHSYYFNQYHLDHIKSSIRDTKSNPLNEKDDKNVLTE
jgi:hypothetical protein